MLREIFFKQLYISVELKCAGRGTIIIQKPEDFWSCIAHLSAEDMLKSVVTEKKKFKNIEFERFGPRSVNDLNLSYS